MKKNKFMIQKIAFMVCIIILLLPVTNIQAASKVKLNKTIATIEVDKTVKLKIINAKKSVKWSSKDKRIVTVSSKGVVRGKKAGTIETIQELEPDATVITDGFTVSQNGVIDASGDVEEWLKGLDY